MISISWWEARNSLVFESLTTSQAVCGFIELNCFSGAQIAYRLNKTD